MRFPFFIVILLSALSSRAEILSGTVKDKADSKELPYVNYYVYANNSKSQIQGISNEHGYFEMNIDSMEFPIRIIFKMIGYQSKEILVKEKSSLTIYLESSVITIKQVEINAYSAKSILNNCLQQIQTNLYSRPFNYEVFYQKRQTDRIGNFLYSTEYYSKIYQQLGEGPGIINLKTRFLSSNDKYYQKALDEGLWEIRSMLSFELYTSSLKKPSIGIINSKNLSDLSLKIIGEVSIDNDDYYKISYSADTTNDDYRYGLAYVNMKDFGLIYFSSNLMINKKLKLEKEFYYTKIDDKYFLNHIEGVNYNTDGTIDKTILFVNKLEFKDVQVINNNTKSIIGTSLKKEQHFEPDSSFWKGVSYVPNSVK